MHKLLRATVIMSLLLGTSLAAKAADLPPRPVPRHLSRTSSHRSLAGPGSILAATLAAAGAGVTWSTLYSA